MTVSEKIQFKSQKIKDNQKNTLKDYVQLQVTGNSHSLPDGRKVLFAREQWVKDGTVQCTGEAN